MSITDFYAYVHNNYIISEHLQTFELRRYVDKVIDEINDRLNATFPVFSDWADFCTEFNDNKDPEEEGLDPLIYTAFPAKYLRSVVAPGVALAFFSNDEEGEQTSGRFFIEYEQGLFRMTRDYINHVPTMYQLDGGGYIDTSFNERDNYKASNEGIVMRRGDY